MTSKECPKIDFCARGLYVTIRDVKKMDESKKYAVLLCVRNGFLTIERALESLLMQVHPPEVIVVVDDGSTNGTPLILQQFQGQMIIITRPDRGFSALGSYFLAGTYNVGLNVLALFDWDYLLIAAEDTFFPVEYAQLLLQEITPLDGVVGGTPFGIQYNPDYPSGAGRFISRVVFRELGFQYPYTYAWEDSVLFCAQYLGLQVRKSELVFFTRPLRDNFTRFQGWGRAMKDAHYYWLYALGRIGKIISQKKFRQGLAMLWGYIRQPRLPHYPVYAYVLNSMQKQHVRRLLR